MERGTKSEREDEEECWRVRGGINQGGSEKLLGSEDRTRAREKRECPFSRRGGRSRIREGGRQGYVLPGFRLTPIDKP
eukprot:2029545-Rhodomonas_salina.1